MNRFRFFGFRIVTLLAAAAIFSAALWSLAADLMRPATMPFPADAKTGATLDTAKGRSERAAQIGLFRGDLWSEAAIANAGSLLFETKATSDIAEARTIAIRAASLAPHNSQTWLALAALELSRDAASSKASEALKLSYFTGSSFATTPARLAVAVRSSNFDDELQALVQTEIESVVLKRPDMKPAIAQAYRTASSKGREIIEGTLALADPVLLDAISPERPRK